MTTIKVLYIINLFACPFPRLRRWRRIDSASSLNRVVANANLSRFDKRRVHRVVRFRRPDGLRRHEGLISARRTDGRFVRCGERAVGMGMKCRTN